MLRLWTAEQGELKAADIEELTRFNEARSAPSTEHGSSASAVTVEIEGDVEDVVITIHNESDIITAAQLDGLFNPLKLRGGSKSAAIGPTGNLGLGLYITERIVNTHGGRVDVDSSEAGGTTFKVLLPRRQKRER